MRENIEIYHHFLPLTLSEATIGELHLAHRELTIMREDVQSALDAVQDRLLERLVMEQLGQTYNHDGLAEGVGRDELPREMPKL